MMEATYRALCANGFASLTMQDIADEADKSTSLLHYHYDTKQDLLVAFLRYLIARFEERFEDTENKDPEERLRDFVSRMVPDEDGEDDYDRFGLAIMELRMQAPYEDAYREQLRTNEAVIRSRLADVVRDGIEEGVFREVDPDRTARLIFDALDGARSERVTVGADEAPAEVAAALDEFVLSSLLARADESTESDEGGETE
ncbi:TetR family transcriptional regulator C-terminal domain-containing protein [Halogeometricum sp. S1BR25-6]|uniref:TetR family transcriptional regulator C-terminal domain-containing protein n=1 Tax=Halogeometricum salsisoli TaxID=2950536 RepID=A0ABU2GFW1_9EURY|nr:TetR/AcrR family transcriptional regulator [Halogeometricum sp. S1BR25-6]MDS0299695.1 TetR family transcriptional regulator C-terminal domain-containing protein [Halogeometricum sp. S1BR25-6]